MRRIYKILISLLTAIPLISSASVLGVQQGGTALQYPLTGFQSGSCLMGNGIGAIGTTTCGGAGTFPFTPTSYGVSTSTTIGFLNGLFSTASSTFSSSFWLSALGTGAVYSQSGLILSHATTSASAASQDVWRDANQNAFAQNFVSAGTSFPTNGGTVTLTNASPRNWIFTGTLTQTMKLPAGTTLSVGATYTANDNSTGNVTVVDNGSNVLATVIPGGKAEFVISDTSTSNGTWDAHALLGHSNVSGSNNLGIGTSSIFYSTFASTTGPQLSLSAGAGLSQWIFANEGGIFYLSTSTTAGTATSSTAALSVGLNGHLTIPSISAASGNNCVQVDTTGKLTNTGSACGSGGGGTDPFTHPAVGQSATTSLMLLYGQASSTLFSANYGQFGATASTTLTTDGKIGLGTTSPFAKLSVQANSGETNALLFQVSSSTSAFATTSLFGVYNDGRVNIGGNSTNFFNINGSVPASVATTPGTSALNVSFLTGGGGNTTIGTTGTGGQGGTFQFQSGTGGDVTSAATAATGGKGGNFQFTSGTGAAPNAGATTDTGGDGGDFLLTAGTGGAPVSGSSNIGGKGGSFTLQAGAGGSPLFGTTGGNGGDTVFNSGNGGGTFSTTGGNGGLLSFTTGNGGSNNGSAGSMTFLPGAPNGTGAIGKILLGCNTTNTCRGLIGIGTSTPATYILTSFALNAPQFSLSAGAGLSQWTFANEGGKLYFSTTTVAGTATSSLSALTIDNNGKIIANCFSVDGTTCLSGGGLSSYDAWTHPLLGLSATTSQMLFGTSTAGSWGITVATSTAPQLSLSTGAGLAQWTFANEGGNLYFSTTTVAGTATTTTSALSVAGGGFGTTTVTGLNISAQATSTSNVGYNITTGCYAVNGACVSGGTAPVMSYSTSTTVDTTRHTIIAPPITVAAGDVVQLIGTCDAVDPSSDFNYRFNYDSATSTSPISPNKVAHITLLVNYPGTLQYEFVNTVTNCTSGTLSSARLNNHAQ